MWRNIKNVFFLNSQSMKQNTYKMRQNKVVKIYGYKVRTLKQWTCKFCPDSIITFLDDRVLHVKSECSFASVVKWHHAAKFQLSLIKFQMTDCSEPSSCFMWLRTWSYWLRKKKTDLRKDSPKWHQDGGNQQQQICALNGTNFAFLSLSGL